MGLPSAWAERRAESLIISLPLIPRIKGSLSFGKESLKSAKHFITGAFHTSFFHNDLLFTHFQTGTLSWDFINDDD